MESAGARDQHPVGLRDVGIGDTAVDRTDGSACLVVVEADALGALLRHDVEDLVDERRTLGPVGRIPFDAMFAAHIVDDVQHGLVPAGGRVDDDVYVLGVRVVGQLHSFSV